MSISTHIVGFVPPDKKWKQMKAVYDACAEADIKLPAEVDSFFNGEKPDDNGQTIRIEAATYQKNRCSGLEIEIDKIPPQVKIIRFYNAW
jgi:hypothetical protein